MWLSWARYATSLRQTKFRQLAIRGFGYGRGILPRRWKLRCLSGIRAPVESLTIWVDGSDSTLKIEKQLFGYITNQLLHIEFSSIWAFIEEVQSSIKGLCLTGQSRRISVKGEDRKSESGQSFRLNIMHKPTFTQWASIYWRKIETNRHLISRIKKEKGQVSIGELFPRYLPPWSYWPWLRSFLFQFLSGQLAWPVRLRIHGKYLVS